MAEFSGSLRPTSPQATGLDAYLAKAPRLLALPGGTVDGYVNLLTEHAGRLRVAGLCEILSIGGRELFRARAFENIHRWEYNPNYSERNATGRSAEGGATLELSALRSPSTALSLSAVPRAEQALASTSGLASRPAELPAEAKQLIATILKICEDEMRIHPSRLISSAQDMGYVQGALRRMRIPKAQEELWFKFAEHIIGCEYPYGGLDELFARVYARAAGKPVDDSLFYAEGGSSCVRSSNPSTRQLVHQSPAGSSRSELDTFSSGPWTISTVWRGNGASCAHQHFDGVIQTSDGLCDLFGGEGGVFISQHSTNAAVPLGNSPSPLDFVLSAVSFGGEIYISGRYNTVSAVPGRERSAVYRLSSNGDWERIGRDINVARLRLAVALVDGSQILYARADLGGDGCGLYEVSRIGGETRATRSDSFRKIPSITPNVKGRAIISLGDLIVLTGSESANSQLTLFNPRDESATPLNDPYMEILNSMRSAVDARLVQPAATTMLSGGVKLSSLSLASATTHAATPQHATRSLGVMGKSLLVGFPSIPLPDSDERVGGALWDRERWLPILVPPNVNLVTNWLAANGRLFAAAGVSSSKDPLADLLVRADGERDPLRFAIFEASFSR